MRAEYHVVAPEFGIAEGAVVRPPDDGLPLWLAAVSLRRSGPDHGAYSATVVGAAGLTRGNAWVRGVGEAVERYALAPTGEDDPDAAALELPEVTRELAEHGIVGALPEGGPVLPAVRLATGEPCAVPRPAVDYPGPEADDLTDQTPSGAASGLDAERALVSATWELIERDAFERAWQGVAVPHRIGIAEVGATAAPDARGSLDALGALTRRHGHRVRLGMLPTITGTAAVTALVQRGDGPVGVGCSAGVSVAACAVKAIVEGIQVESLLSNWRAARHGDPDAVSGRPRTEAERLDYLCSRAATGAADAFAASFAPRDADVRSPDPAAARATSAALAAGLAAAGVHLFAVDLTPRLPGPVRALGWRAVRVLPAGLQPLRGNDRLAWNWAPNRMSGRIGPTGASPRPPHPLA